MRRVSWLVVVACFSAAACSVNTEPSGAGTSTDAGASGGTGGADGGGVGGTNCFPSPTQKFCGGASCPEKTDPDHGCAQSSCAACSLSNAVANCATDGSCGLDHCIPGFSDCDNDASDGCEVNTDADPSNCGTCGNNCFKPGDSTNWVCKQGSCEVSNCPTGKGDCNNDSTDGCEIDLTSDPKNCKFCGNDCSSTVQHATVTCTNSVCGYSKCDAGWADCDGNPANGCEQDIGTDAQNCGACGNVCSNANGNPACVGGTCTIGCQAGFGNCDGNLKNGCETNTNTDVKHCGSCSTVCSTNNASASCNTGKCQISCKGGFADCDKNISNGCEANLGDATTCGSCTNDCSTQVTHATASCGGGNCTYSGACAGGWGDCDGNKANGCETPLNSTTNCGGCGKNCNGVQNATAVCSTGTCGYSGACSVGWGDCDGNTANGCETNLTNATNHCGTCGTDCTSSVANADGVACSTSQCTYGSCKGGFDDCDGNKANGCEAKLDQPTTCGSCTNDCTQTVLNVGTVTCGGGGTCSYSGPCDAGYDDCDGNKANGCETALNTHDYCGSCTNKCKPNETCDCSTGTCGCK